MEGFKPFGAPKRKTRPIILFFEEYESIRLVDYKNLNQQQAAEKMCISRPTFTRMYDKARKKIAKALIGSNTLLIKGGSFITDHYWYKCASCHEIMSTREPLEHCITCDSECIIQMSSCISKTIK
jgi:predicted DNA-binding protein (UPF0251 family)